MGSEAGTGTGEIVLLGDGASVWEDGTFWRRRAGYLPNTVNVLSAPELCIEDGEGNEFCVVSVRPQ